MRGRAAAVAAAERKQKEAAGEAPPAAAAGAAAAAHRSADAASAPTLPSGLPAQRQDPAGPGELPSGQTAELRELARLAAEAQRGWEHERQKVTAQAGLEERGLRERLADFGVACEDYQMQRMARGGPQASDLGTRSAVARRAARLRADKAALRAEAEAVLQELWEGIADSTAEAALLDEAAPAQEAARDAAAPARAARPPAAPAAPAPPEAPAPGALADAETLRRLAEDTARVEGWVQQLAEREAMQEAASPVFGFERELRALGVLRPGEAGHLGGARRAGAEFPPGTDGEDKLWHREMARQRAKVAGSPW